jgi:hypothetical protein
VGRLCGVLGTYLGSRSFHFIDIPPSPQNPATYNSQSYSKTGEIRKRKTVIQTGLFSYIGLTVAGSLELPFPLSSLKPLHLEICLVGTWTGDLLCSAFLKVKIDGRDLRLYG